MPTPYAKGSYHSGNVPTQPCLGYCKLEHFDEAYVRVKQFNPTWSEARVRQRAMVERQLNVASEYL